MRHVRLFLVLLSCFAFVGCSTGRQLHFTGDKWNYDALTATVVNSDTTVRFTFGQPQTYGSQGNIDENGVFVPTEIIDPENIRVYIE